MPFAVTVRKVNVSSRPMTAQHDVNMERFEPGFVSRHTAQSLMTSFPYSLVNFGPHLTGYLPMRAQSPYAVRLVFFMFSKASARGCAGSHNDEQSEDEG
jgi:hypothetical protein